MDNSRREALGGIGAGLAGLALAAATGPGFGGAASAEPVAAGTTLFGSAVQPHLLAGHPGYRAAIQRHCRIIVPEGGLKWEGLRPTSTTFDFSAADSYVAFGAESGIALRGHTLAWHAAMPAWTSEIATPTSAFAALGSHIRTVAGRYASRIQSWDVVNEPLPDEPTSPRDRQECLWLRRLGPEYIPLALRAARTAAPKAELVINEYDLEFSGTRFDIKRSAMLDLAHAVKRSGAPLDAIGLQAHLRGEREIDRQALQRFVRELADMKLAVVVTELDCTDWSLPADIATRDQAVADRAEAFLDAVFEVCRPRAVLTWGLTDRHAWVPDYHKRRDGAPNRPLPLDENYQPKPLMRVLDRFRAVVEREQTRG